MLAIQQSWLLTGWKGTNKDIQSLFFYVLVLHPFICWVTSPQDQWWLFPHIRIFSWPDSVREIMTTVTLLTLLTQVLAITVYLFPTFHSWSRSRWHLWGNCLAEDTQWDVSRSQKVCLWVWQGESWTPVRELMVQGDFKLGWTFGTKFKCKFVRWCMYVCVIGRE